MDKTILEEKMDMKEGRENAKNLTGNYVRWEL